MTKIHSVFRTNKVLLYAIAAFALLLLFSCSWGGFKISSVLLQASFFLLLSVCMQYMVKHAEDELHNMLCGICIILTVFFILFFSNRYLQSVTMGKAGLWLTLLLAVWAEYLFRTPWVLVLFAFVLFAMDSGFAILVLPGLALLACAAVQAVPDSRKKKKQQKEDMKLQNVWNCYLPALLLCVSAVGMAIYKFTQTGIASFTGKTVWAMLANAGISLLPFSIPPAVLFYKTLRKHPKCFLYNVMLAGMLLPLLAIPLALLAGGEPFILFSAFMALVFMQYMLLFVLLRRKQIPFAKTLKCEQDFLSVCLLLCVPVALRQLWSIGGMLFL